VENLLSVLISYIPSLSLDTLDPQVVQAIYVFGIVFLLFLLLVVLGFTRHHIIENSLHGFWAGLWTGLIMIAVLEGVIFWGAKNFMFGEKLSLLPPGIQNILASGKEGVTGVLGVETEREQPTASAVLSDYKLLSPVDLELVNNTVCKSKDD
jgi:hypothetical protein